MNKIIIELEDGVIKAALLENARPVEFIVENFDNNPIKTGNIYIGKVEKVLKSGFAFIDVGEKAFLNLNDNRELPFKHLIKQGSNIPVQILSDGIDKKGSHLTARLFLSGQFLVLEQPSSTENLNINISSKITDKLKKQSLFDSVSKISRHFNIIIRTEAQNVSANTLEQEYNYLSSKLFSIQKDIEFFGAKAPYPIYKPHSSHSANIVFGLLKNNVSEIVINNTEEYESIKQELSSCGKNQSVILEHSPFKLYGLEKKLENTKLKRVWLPSGGYILIEKTAACTVIDVNSGKYSGRKNLEDMSFKINMEAATEIAYSLRLRNISGIIIIDFLKTGLEENIKTLTNHLSALFLKDSVPCNILGLTKLGLMEITRKKTRKPLWN